MRSSMGFSALLLAALLGGCGTSYIYGQTGPDAPGKGAGCQYPLLDAVPDRPFDELGVLAPSDIEFPDVAGGATPFKEAVSDQVCAAGGDAVVVERDFQGRYIRGTVIKFK